MVEYATKNAAIVTIVIVVLVVIVVLWIVGAIMTRRRDDEKRRRRHESDSEVFSDDEHRRFETGTALVEHGRRHHHNPTQCTDSTSSTTTLETISFPTPSTLSTTTTTCDTDKSSHHWRSRSPSRSKSSSSSSSSSSSDSHDNDCIGEGLQGRCRNSDDCACGLSCEHGRCVCPKPPPPTVNLQSFGQNLIAMWTAVPGADFYNIVLQRADGTVVSSQQFFTGLMATFNNLVNGTYHIIAYSGSNDCGVRQTFSRSVSVTIGNGPNPNPPGPCVVPTITGVTLNGTWPGPIQFVFHTTGAPDDGINSPQFVINWRAFGGNNQQVVSGQLAPATALPGGRWPAVPVSNFPSNDQCAGQPCCAPFNFGCPAAGCTAPNSRVSFELFNVTVTNACGLTSVPTCWRVQDMCLPGPQQLTPFTCQ